MYETLKVLSDDDILNAITKVREYFYQSLYSCYSQNSDLCAQYIFGTSLMIQILHNAGLENYYYVVSELIKNPDQLLPVKVALHKSTEWQHEKEWRLFCTGYNNINQLGNECDYILKCPVALYLCRKIRPYHEKILTEIAREKGLPVYKMQINEGNSSYSLIKRMERN